MRPTVKAYSIGEETTIGVSGKAPFTHGNCFGVHTGQRIWSKEPSYKIVNFNVENLRHLLEAGLTWPIEIFPISERHALIHDKRIPREFYDKEYCSLCCPRDLWPEPQRMEWERRVMRGEIEEKPKLGNESPFDCAITVFHPGKRPTLGLPPEIQKPFKVKVEMGSIVYMEL